MAGTAFSLRRDGDALHVQGRLGFDTAAQVLAEGSAVLAAGDVLRLDLAAVGSVDSAGLACVLALLAEGRRRGRMPTVQGATPALLALARVCDVEAYMRSASD